MTWLTWIVTPLVGAVIGYFTNWLAIKMLFRPHTEKRVLGVRIPFTPGLIPKERARLTVKIADTVGKHVLTPEVLARELASANIWGNFRRAFEGATVGEALERAGVADPAALVERFLTEALRDAKTRDALVPEALAEALKHAAGGWLPQTVGAAERWVSENAWLDARLEPLLRKVIDDNLGRLVGLFIDHKKIYANIKRGVFEYLTDRENQQFLLDKINETIDRFRSGALNDAVLPEKLSEIIKGVCERLCALRMDDLLGYAENLTREWRVLEKAAAYLAKHIRVKEMITEKLNAFAVDEAEALILGVVNRELQAITWLGGALGLLIGLASLVPQLY